MACDCEEELNAIKKLLKEILERIKVSAPVRKSSSSAGLMSSRPMGGDAVINSIGVSICGEFLGTVQFPQFRAE